MTGIVGATGRLGPAGLAADRDRASARLSGSLVLLVVAVLTCLASWCCCCDDGPAQQTATTAVAAGVTPGAVHATAGAVSAWGACSGGPRTEPAIRPPSVSRQVMARAGTPAPAAVAFPSGVPAGHARLDAVDAGPPRAGLVRALLCVWRT